MISIFNSSQDHPRVGAFFVQIWWFQLKSVTSYHGEKRKLTDGGADRQTGRPTDVGNDNTPSAWFAKGWQLLVYIRSYD